MPATRREEARLLVRDRGVQHLAQEERRDDAERRREDDQAADLRETPPVGPEEPEDAAQVRLAHRRSAGALRRVVG